VIVKPLPSIFLAITKRFLVTEVEVDIGMRF
jgi:hypothetical protein